MLGPDDPPPAIATNPGGSSPFLLIGDHAGRAIPRRLGGLGVAPEAMDRHIAWDIGVAGLGEKLAPALDAAFIRQAYSRLVIDCNRRLDAPDSIPTVSDGTAIPGNAGLDDAGRAARRDAIYTPYQARIARALDGRAGRRTFLVSLHSFTPAMGGIARPWRYGVLHRGDSALSHRMLALLRRELGEAVGDNQPYAMDGTDNTVPLHADPRGLDYLELEVRQDLIADDAGQAEAAEMIGRLLGSAA
ncbi:MAG TPA: N-formylglutamate amidohydrolase [Caulobacteraceae bacterium]|nr:N-formylglutamate amidohydrolase [Caulobacteraceae bacterium]